MLLPHNGKVVYINEFAVDAIVTPDTDQIECVYFGDRNLAIRAEIKKSCWKPLSSTEVTLLIDKDIATWEELLNKINDFIDASSRVSLEQQLEMFRNNIQLPDKTHVLDRGELAMIDRSKILFVATDDDGDACILQPGGTNVYLNSVMEDGEWIVSSVNDISLFLANDINFIKSYVSNNEEFIKAKAIAAINKQTKCLEDKINECQITLPTSLPTKVEPFSL